MTFTLWLHHIPMAISLITLGFCSMPLNQIHFYFLQGYFICTPSLHTQLLTPAPFRLKLGLYSTLIFKNQFLGLFINYTIYLLIYSFHFKVLLDSKSHLRQLSFAQAMPCQLDSCCLDLGYSPLLTLNFHTASWFNPSVADNRKPSLIFQLGQVLLLWAPRDPFLHLSQTDQSPPLDLQLNSTDRVDSSVFSVFSRAKHRQVWILKKKEKMPSTHLH